MPKGSTLQHLKAKHSNCLECCQCFGSCMIKSVSWTIYVLMYVVPTIIEISLLVYYASDDVTIKIIIATHSSLLIATTVYAGVKLVIDLMHTGYNYTHGCNNAFCKPLYKPKTLLAGGHWFLMMLPWLACNIICTWVFWSRLVDSAGIIIMVFSPFVLFPIMTGWGYAISLELRKSQRKKEQKIRAEQHKIRQIEQEEKSKQIKQKQESVVTNDVVVNVDSDSTSSS